MKSTDDARNNETRRIPSARWRVPLSPSEARELDEYLAQPALRLYEDTGALWHAHLHYSRSAATSLALGELWDAQRAAAIATYALSLYRDRGGRAHLVRDVPEVEGRGEPAG